MVMMSLTVIEAHSIVISAVVMKIKEMHIYHINSETISWKLFSAVLLPSGVGNIFSQFIYTKAVFSVAITI